ncbi:heptahelical transmembrane protein ADIPOR1 [Magnolia sinica]|uniref:heptahelical transmembrane protein ADIPOR1 n=1 Tax=Magnolia sinica TaxID=86752 RepID=UPI0026588CFA|nr:heptahelical transmembrane protein ADIPOR1 [Magnolia sinica]
MNSNQGCVSKRKKRGMESGVLTKGEEEEKIEKQKKKKMKCDLVSYMELPDYMKDNEYILNYYRVNWPLKEAFFSVFRWHNETLNIWTHLIGFFVFLGLTIANLENVPKVSDLISNFTRSLPISARANTSENNNSFFWDSSTLTDLEKTTAEISTVAQQASRWPFFVFLGGSMFCLLSSSLCHLLGCRSHRFNLLLLRIDYAGIAIMIVASFFPPIYYIFQCDPHWQFIYLALITTMGILTVLTLLSPTHSTGAFRAFRACLFLAMGFSGIIPALHAVSVNWSEPRCAITLAYELAMALSYVTGTLFYVSRIPEKWKPGMFDLAGHSHQIFHVFVILGALAHYGAALIFIEWRDHVGCDKLV